jgi:hypothetical protein
MGQKFLENQVDQSGELREKFSQGFIPFLPFLGLGSHSEIPHSLRNLFTTLQSLRVVISSNPSPEILKELAQAADRFTKELEKIRKKFETQE